MNSTGAIMGQSRFKVTPPIEVSGQAEDKNEVTQVNRKQVNETAALASLNNQSGWIVLEQMMRQDIDRYKSGSFLGKEVNDHTDSKKLGDLLKVEMQVAARLDSYIRKVNSAYETTEQEKEQKRVESRQRRASSNPGS